MPIDKEVLRSHLKYRTAEIEKSDIFLSILDQDTLDNAVNYIQMLYAKDLKKPMFYFVPEGITIPNEYTEGVEHLQIVRISETDLTAKQAADLIHSHWDEIKAFTDKVYGGQENVPSHKKKKETQPS